MSSRFSSLLVPATLTSAFALAIAGFSSLSTNEQTTPDHAAFTATAQTPENTEQSARDAFLTLLETGKNDAATIKEIRNGLKSAGHDMQSVEGAFDVTVSNAVISFLQAQPDRAATLAPWITSRLVEHGHQKTLSDMIFKTPGQWDGVSTQIQILTRDPKSLSRDDMRHLQGLMLAIGAYSGPADGKENHKFHSAIININMYFKTGDISLLQGQTVARGQLAERSLSAYVPSHSTRYQATGALVLSAPLANSKLTSSYRMRRLSQFDSFVRLHQGIDLGARERTPVLAAAGGRVVHAGVLGKYGNSVIVDHGHGVLTHYAHLHSYVVRRGEELEPGEVLGRVGKTGRATAPHLHFEVIVHKDDGRPVAVNPLKVLGQDLGYSEVRRNAIADAHKTWPGRSGQIVEKLGL